MGADQRVYGPATVEQVQQWIAEGRANGATLVQVEGCEEWLALALDPAFAEALAAKAAAATPPPRLLTPDYRAMAEAIRSRDYEVSITRWLGRGWDLLANNFLVFVGATLLIKLALFVAAIIPPNCVAATVLFAVFVGGLQWLFLKRLRGQPAGVEDAFAGFTLGLVQLMLAGTISLLLIGLGFTACLLPGIYLAVCWLLFVPLLVIDRKLEFWPAMELSRRVVQKHWWKLLGFGLVVSFVALSGFLLCGIGALITFPWALGATVCAYQDIFGEAPAVANPAPPTRLLPTPPDAPLDPGPDPLTTRAEA